MMVYPYDFVLCAGIYMDEADLKQMAACGGEGQSQAILDNIRCEVTALKSRVQTNKQHVSLLKGDVQDSMEEYRPPVSLSQQRPTQRWTTDELAIAVLGINDIDAINVIKSACCRPVPDGPVLILF